MQTLKSSLNLPKDIDWSNPDLVNGKLLNAMEATGLRQFGLKQKEFVELLPIFTPSRIGLRCI
ncbi:unnamed protein product [Brassica napus]|uniref:(rape) hypothetical protein n=1 Tax=Brassica napus TaxID=3708 RepID=A0A816P3E7_BRANA|nr:unnamed protein product [Brassica napus]